MRSGKKKQMKTKKCENCLEKVNKLHFVFTTWDGYSEKLCITCKNANYYWYMERKVEKIGIWKGK